MSKIKHEDIASLIKERIDNFELNPNQCKVIVIDSIPAHLPNEMIYKESMIRMEPDELIRPMSLLCKQDKKKDRFGNYIKRKFK